MTIHFELEIDPRIWIPRLLCRWLGHKYRIARVSREAFRDVGIISLPRGLSLIYPNQAEAESEYCLRCMGKGEALAAERFWQDFGFKVIDAKER